MLAHEGDDPVDADDDVEDGDDARAQGQGTTPAQTAPETETGQPGCGFT